MSIFTLKRARTSHFSVLNPNRPQSEAFQTIKSEWSTVVKQRASLIFSSLALSVLMFSITLITPQVQLWLSVMWWSYSARVWDDNDPGLSLQMDVVLHSLMVRTHSCPQTQHNTSPLSLYIVMCYLSCPKTVSRLSGKWSLVFVFFLNISDNFSWKFQKLIFSP